MARRNGVEFHRNKLLLEAEEASPVDIIRLLFSSDIKQRKFVDCPEEHKRREFKRRWLIFISIVVQKLLFCCRTPMAQMGNALEVWLNLLSSNGGFFMLLWNLFMRKVVRPDRSSATYKSMLGYLDWRVDLDKNIRPGHYTKYYASLCLMAAKLSYENEAFIESVVEDHWNMEFLGFFSFWNDHQNRGSTRAFMLQDTQLDPKLIVVAFRGTHPFDAYQLMTDFDLSWYELPGVGKIHRGFMQALGLQNDGWPREIEQQPDRLYAYYAIRQMLRDALLKNERTKFVLTGHSMGAALAILFAGVLALHEEAWLLERLEGVYSFAQPRVGDQQFGEYMEDKLRRHDVRYLRYVYCNDMVPRLPYDDQTLLYKHFGPCLYYNSCYKGKVVLEEPNKNYFSLFHAVPKITNAVGELIRSFRIPYDKGPDYRESWFMKACRIIGLAFPGLSAHGPQDYDNLVRLGSLNTSPRQQDTLQELHQASKTQRQD